MSQEMIGFLMAVASAGWYANDLHLAPDRQQHQLTSLNFYRLGALSDAQSTEGAEQFVAV